MTEPTDEMTRFLTRFDGNAGRLAKYTELLLFGEGASPIATTDKESLGEVNIVLTTKCNLACVWCHREEDHYKESGYLDRDGDFDKVARLLPELQGFKMLHWAGLSEPLLYPRLFELTKLARQYVPGVKITTNGTPLQPKVVTKIIDSGITYVEVSIDGFDGAANQRYRGNDEGKVIEYLKDLSARSDIPIQINTVLADVNYRSLWDAIDRLKDVSNIVSIHTIPIFVTKHIQEEGIGEVSPEQHRELLEHWERRIIELGLSIKLSPDSNGAVLDPVIAMKRQRNICFTVYEDPYINVDGYLTPCGRLQHIGLDNVFELGFEAAWNGPKSLKWREEQLRGNYGVYCQRECHMKNNCGKQDPAPVRVPAEGGAA